jgi:thiamine biosynthesis protein ThiI
MQTDTYLLRLGEVTLKKRNRKWFITNLIRILKPRVVLLDATIERRHKKLLLITKAPREEVKKALSTVFGLVGVSPVYRMNHDMNHIQESCLELMKPHFGTGKTFAVKAKRVKKDFPLNSPEIQEAVAGYLFDHSLDLPVRLKSPDLALSISIEFKEAWISLETWPGLGGLPVARKNRFGLLLSGGIDSPVAGNLIQKRGGMLEAIYFHTPPFTVESAKDKVIDLAEILAGYQNGLNLHVVNFSHVMKTLKSTCHDSLMVVLSRRFMMRVAEKIILERGGNALVTGESLGQVASQTIENIGVVNEIASLPILRPLIGMDKVDIIRWARKMDSFETSIRPYEDCCSLFAPEEPATRATPSRVRREEARLDIDELVNSSLEQTELYTL